MLGQNDWKFEIDPIWGKQLNSEIRPNNAHALMFWQDRLVLATDHPDHNVIEYDYKGNVVDSWGKQWPGLHGLKGLVENNEMSLFLVDSGWVVNRRWDGESVDDWASPFNKMIAQAGSITKTTRSGQVIFSVGHPVTYGAYAAEMSFNPTDVVVLNNGEFYVIDGYGSDYILHFNRHGQFLKKFGQDGVHRINNGHGITMDERGDESLLLVSSRAEHSLMWYTLDGQYVKSLTLPGAFIHAPIFLDDHMLAPVCWTGERNRAEDNSGVICIFDEANTLVSVLGAELPLEGELLSGKGSPFCHCHGLECDDKGNIYLAQWNANGLHPQKLLRL
ncbi:peptidylglycine monooxygenase [Alteromonas sp. KC3]|uniref:6-bladed beta-propeller n=1 Tax=unclassified Alteromonas TaxID=2614992 RepID=UPI0019240965|nr:MULTISPECIES: 6-bladed beta-propeller [unclassified Alteromonas]BCO18809.1 peptidylglycine monooxygenase [Alteromonas sp. KC3]BCO22772.1 peptidylglycine monooxygenase [Alteromonas sp. KC14]